MDPGFRTPLLDFFRRGDVARDVRLLAAQGVLAPRAHEHTPLAVSMNLLPRLNDRDLRMLSTDPNVPDVLRTSAGQKTLANR
jgi:hypothetical protein